MATLILNGMNMARDRPDYSLLDMERHSRIISAWNRQSAPRLWAISGWGSDMADTLDEAKLS